MSDDFMDLLSGEGSGKQGKDEKGMEDLLGGLLGGSSGAGGLGSLLGGLMGGGSQADDAGDAGDMAGMLGSLLGGGAAPQSSGGGGDMAGMLGSLLGGGAPEPQPAAGGAGDLLGSLLGGSSGSSSGGGLGGLLGGLLGGGSGGPMSFGGGGGGASLPFAGTLAEKLGISEQMANMLIMGAIGLLTSSMAKNRSGGSVDYNSLTDADFIRASGVSSRLSGQMGISEDDTIVGLQQTMDLLIAGNQPAAKPQKTTAKKTTKKTKAASDKAATPKKSSTKSTKSTPKKKSAKKESGSDFMDLLDDPKG